MDIEGQQDQHTPLGTATACISERVAPGVQYGATWTEVEEPPRKQVPPRFTSILAFPPRGARCKKFMMLHD